MRSLSTACGVRRLSRQRGTSEMWVSPFMVNSLCSLSPNQSFLPEDETKDRRCKHTGAHKYARRDERGRQADVSRSTKFNQNKPAPCTNQRGDRSYSGVVSCLNLTTFSRLVDRKSIVNPGDVRLCKTSKNSIKNDF